MSQTYRSMEQNDSPEINPHVYGQVIYRKGTKNVWWGKDSLLHKWCWENQIQKNETGPLSYNIYKDLFKKSKQIKDLNIRPETIELLEENNINKLLDIDPGDNFLNLTPKAKVTKVKINKLDYIKPKSFCIAKETIQQNEKQCTGQEKLFAKHISDKGLISRLYK